MYLQLFEDIGIAGQYAWGTAALALLYQALSKVVRPDHQHLSGSATLYGEKTAEDREYGLHIRQTALCRTYLICGHICEESMPDRVLRQFGLHQGIRRYPLQRERREIRGKMIDNSGDELKAEIDMSTNRLEDISHATELLREGYNSRNWDLIGEALDVLKIYDPEVAGEEVFEELELDDEMDDNVSVWHPSQPDEGPSNTQLIPTPIQPEEPKWQLRPCVARREESSSHQQSNTKLQLPQWAKKLPVRRKCS
ncbi:hypothetical protein AMTR_s00052p00172250 [Amborella trichopoda]|uniref:Aminotransferase-like plant mobile domain-containing protein n=1 Tax=Amborella trichopoda TaxID=13333 RepID=U5D4T9_AMBTC|nr:hypothetical protein AMTR_s00052p00172250 [Amborella trichopoda]